MRRPLALLAASAAMVLALAVLTPPALGQGAGKWFKFLFTPQAGWNSACLSCGWHSGGCVGPTPPPGPALDFPASCSDTGYDVYFRAFGLKPSGGDEWVAFGTPSTVPGGICVETQVRIRDKDASRNLGWILYMHTYQTRSGDMLMYVNQSGRPNQYVFASMAHEPDQPENSDCVQAGYWTGPHVHEYHTNGDNNIFPRDGDRYPCAPASGGPYDPQNWGADWARIFCIDDTDCDGWTDDEEHYVGTDSWDPCPDDRSDDAWPLDIDKSGDISVTGDVFNYRGRLGARPGSPKWSQRLDLDQSGDISVTGDIFLYRGRIGQTCV